MMKLLVLDWYKEKGRQGEGENPARKHRHCLRHERSLGSFAHRFPGIRSTLDRKLGNQENGSMKTTLDLPDLLVKQVKLRAVRDGQKLKDAVADLLRKGLAA